MTDKLLLLIDDDQDDIMFFGDALKEVNPAIQLKTFNNGEDALNYLKEEKPKLNWIFLDLNMPKMNGFQFLKEYKPISNGVPVIIYSTSSLERDKNLTKELGARDFITKPTRISDLASLIKNVLDRNAAI